MLGHRTGVIGLPLRLLAREVYARVAARVGPGEVALITGEEKIIPPNPRYRVCTVEAMPSETDASFLAIDEIQLAGDLERGHIFTDRLLNLRGREETLLLGAATMRGIVERLLPGVNILTRPRMSVLAYTGSKKITRLPTRSAVVAFSADEVYAIAELIRRQRGGAAVVLGSLSPRTRNAQVEIFQSGDVDFLVATDAIGMGLNLDVDHVAFASDRKFDGYQFRRLTAAELGQIAGRAGRHLKDGTFGVTSRVEPFEDALVEALEQHRFDPVKTIQWRNRVLDFSSIDSLQASLDKSPAREGLAKAPPAIDEETLLTMARDPAIAGLADRRDRVALLWDICQVPDFRKIAPANHAELVATLFTYLVRDGAIPDDWFAGQVAYADRTDGDIDTLSNRIAHVRTWTFVANQPNWLRDPPEIGRRRTRAIEDRLSDALYERLTARFVDRRTSVLMRRLKENAMLEAEITEGGDVPLRTSTWDASTDSVSPRPPQWPMAPRPRRWRPPPRRRLPARSRARAEKVSKAANASFVLALRRAAALARPGRHRSARRGRRCAEAAPDLPRRRQPAAAAPRKGRGPHRGMAGQLRRDADQAAVRPARLGKPDPCRPRPRLPPRRRLRCHRPHRDRRGSTRPRPGYPRQPARPGRPLRRLPSLRPHPPQARLGRLPGDAVGAEERWPRPARPRRAFARLACLRPYQRALRHEIPPSPPRCIASSATARPVPVPSASTSSSGSPISSGRCSPGGRRRKHRPRPTASPLVAASWSMSP